MRTLEAAFCAVMSLWCLAAGFGLAAWGTDPVCVLLGHVAMALGTPVWAIRALEVTREPRAK